MQVLLRTCLVPGWKPDICEFIDAAVAICMYVYTPRTNRELNLDEILSAIIPDYLFLDIVRDVSNFGSGSISLGFKL